MIRFFNEETDFKLPQKLEIKNWLNNIAKKEAKRLGEINYIFCNDEYLLDINKQYLEHDYYTDIITFDNTELGQNLLEGEMYISIDRVSDNAKNNNQPFDKELKRVLAHGILHLAGYKDKTEKDEKIMRAKEDFYLEAWQEN